MDLTRVIDLCAAAPLGSPTCQPRGIGDMGAFDPSAHALFVTVGHFRLICPELSGQRICG
jgi:hypothetical protein